MFLPPQELWSDPHRSRTAGSHRLASRSRSRDVQKVEAFPSWCRNHQPGSRRRICGRSQAGSAQSEAGRRSLALTQKSLGDDAELLSRAAQSLLKSLIQNSAAEVPPEAKPPELAPWHSGMTKRKARKESASSSAASRVVPPDPGSGSKKDRCGHQCPKAWGKPTNGVYLSPNEAPTSAHADSSRRQTAH